MFVDASALTAILAGEPDAAALVARLQRARQRLTSPLAVWETTIALARIMMPTSHVRLSAGRTEMSDEMQAMCFLAGANSIFVGETLLTADNPGEDHDGALFRRLGIEPEALGDA